MSDQTERQRKETFIRLTTYLRKSKGIMYKQQAAAIHDMTNTMPLYRMKNIRSNQNSPYPFESEIQALLTVYSNELEGVSDKPEKEQLKDDNTSLRSENEQLAREVDRLRGELKKAIDDKNQALNILENISKK